jgi:hypothetical protein
MPLDAIEAKARQWFGYDSAYAMCLNVALLRGEGAGLAAKLAEGLMQCPLPEAFYLYRTGERIPQLLDMMRGAIPSLVRGREFLSGLVLDALVASRAHDRTIHEDLLRRIINARPDFMVTPSAQAFVGGMIDAVHGAGAADALNPAVAQGGFQGDDIRIAGLTNVRNEGALVESSIGAMLTYCDFVLCVDHLSDDGAPQAAQTKFGADRVEILHVPGMTAFDEKATYDLLFIRAREKGATHFVVLDADELLGPALASREAILASARQLGRGESLCAPVANIYGDGFMDMSSCMPLNDLSRMLPLYRDLLYCDDGSALHRRMPLHNPRPPEGYPRYRYFSSGLESSILHFDRANPMNALIKPDWYIARELLVYKTPLPLVLARYLPVQLVNNMFWDHPPQPHALAVPLIPDYTRLASRQLAETQSLAPHIPPELRFLFNFNYWE